MYVYYVLMCAVQFTFDVVDIKLNMGCQLNVLSVSDICGCQMF